MGPSKTALSNFLFVLNLSLNELVEERQMLLIVLPDVSSSTKVLLRGQRSC